MLWPAWVLIKSFIFETVLPSRLGQIAVAATIAWFWSAHNMTIKYETRIAADKAAAEATYRAELKRQEYATKEIAEAATRRAEDDAEAAKDMQAIIDDYKKKLEEKPDAKVIVNNCRIDSDFSGVVQRLTEADLKAGRAARRTRKVR